MKIEGWDYADCYVCACGKCCSSYRIGKQHEEYCQECQQILNHEDKWEDEEK